MPGAMGEDGLDGVHAPVVDLPGEAAEDAGVRTIQSEIFPENAASHSLHQAFGFRVVGTCEQVGCHHGVWQDVLLI